VSAKSPGPGGVAPAELDQHEETKQQKGAAHDY
jgi:hypothetical protein